MTMIRFMEGDLLKVRREGLNRSKRLMNHFMSGAPGLVAPKLDPELASTGIYSISISKGSF